MKIIVLSLARDLSESDLLEMFTEFGDVESCTLVLDKETGNSKGFGFVEMPSDQEARLAISKLHSRKVNGSVLRVKPAAPPPADSTEADTQEADGSIQ
ncbi:MAG: RNA-binding protein [Gemmatimonadetes bacterium]|jgi:RNA recognition motif-containing protein|nr:RNA-binding protein [Gemmatimonadota bacterium]MBT4610146.1 RNA-binding protein [Gemmatimonadota bacterium]MBT5056222.1 RNA-binding protein [Gemmatimonadota bacterium]MBT5146323.1 RNA-binding protein [Gemmatimonadota bacterium]MBT5591246.1 RNA-binding protein [Gemmatimonadota bacterium]